MYATVEWTNQKCDDLLAKKSLNNYPHPCLNYFGALQPVTAALLMRTFLNLFKYVAIFEHSIHNFTVRAPFTNLYTLLIMLSFSTPITQPCDTMPLSPHTQPLSTSSDSIPVLELPPARSTYQHVAVVVEPVRVANQTSCDTMKCPTPMNKGK